MEEVLKGCHLWFKPQAVRFKPVETGSGIGATEFIRFVFDSLRFQPEV